MSTIQDTATTESVAAAPIFELDLSEVQPTAVRKQGCID